MDHEVKAFIKASLFYLAVGVLIGLHMSFADHGVAELRFIHIHLLLLGFMAMMIYGVGYHILPRFNAKPVRWPGMIIVQYWLANAGLISMVILYAFGAFWQTGGLRAAFGLCGVVEVASILIFVVNMYSVLRDDTAPDVVEDGSASEEPEPMERPSVTINPSRKIGDILDQWPHLEEPMNELGFSALTTEAVRNTAARMVTLSMAVRKNGADLAEVITTLEGSRLVRSDDETPKQPDGFLPSGPQITRGDMADAKTQIGNLMEVYPETREVFASNYGEACFTCPGQKTETVEQTAQMHGEATEKIVAQINAVIAKALKN